MNLKKELTKLVEKEVEDIKEKNKVKNIGELIKDELTISTLKNIYDTRDLLLELYDINEESQMKAKLKKYGLDSVGIYNKVKDFVK